ncbi:MAG: nitrous oxide reductase family maturation protein NosD, partial [Planctomycetota bacterium JB042]
ALAAAGVFAPRSDAAVVRVPKQHATIQAAVDAAAPGDVIVVSKGVHAGPVKVPTVKAGLTIRAKGTVWIENDPTHADSGAVVFVQADDVTLDGLGLRHGGSNAADPIAGGVAVWADGVTLRKLRIHRSKGPAVRVDGDGARVLDCEVRGCREGILVIGNDARVADCDVRMVDRDGVWIDGKDGTIEGCRVVRARRIGLRVEGSGAKVKKNDVFAAGEGGIDVFGALPDVVGNEVRMTGPGGPSIAVLLDADHSITEPGRIRKNRCFGGDGIGIRMSGEASGRVEKNTVVRCGVGSAFQGETGAGIEAFGKDVVDNVVEECAGDGIRAYGHAVLVAGNRAVDNLEDGIEILGGTNPEVRDNVARGNLGEGFENGGTGTVFVGNVAKKNRIDVASTGTFGTYTNNQSNTGGPDAAPEVD